VPQFLDTLSSTHRPAYADLLLLFLTSIARQGVDPVDLAGLIAHRSGSRYALKAFGIAVKRAIGADFAKKPGTEFFSHSRKRTEEVAIGMLADPVSLGIAWLHRIDQSDHRFRNPPTLLRAYNFFPIPPPTPASLNPCRGRAHCKEVDGFVNHRKVSDNEQRAQFWPIRRREFLEDTSLIVNNLHPLNYFICSSNI
jgi:hypothetical protein